MRYFEPSLLGTTIWLIHIDTSRDVTPRACLGGAAGAPGTQAGLLELVSAAVPVLTGVGQGKATHWARKKWLRATPLEYSCTGRSMNTPPPEFRVTRDVAIVSAGRAEAATRRRTRIGRLGPSSPHRAGIDSTDGLASGQGHLQRARTPGYWSSTSTWFSFE